MGLLQVTEKHSEPLGSCRRFARKTEIAPLRLPKLRLLLVSTLFLLLPLAVQAQHGGRLIQLSGLVVSGDSAYGIYGAQIFNPETGRGARSNFVGYFSLPIETGSELTIRCLGYRPTTYAVPDDTSGNLSILIELIPDTIFLAEVEIHALPSERVFKQAVLAMRSDHRELDFARANLDPTIMGHLMTRVGTSPALAAHYYMNEQIALQQRWMQPTTIPLLNPFAWARFLGDIKDNKERREA